MVLIETTPRLKRDPVDWVNLFYWGLILAGVWVTIKSPHIPIGKECKGDYGGKFYTVMEVLNRVV